MAVLTPNMSLFQPGIGVDSGLVWEQDINANSYIIDNHNHAPGSGVQITPAGLNINQQLDFESQDAINLRSTRYTSWNSPLAGSLDLACVYVSDGELFYNDTSGNQVQITTGGLVNATSSGISSGTATASFSGATLIVNAASTTPANVRGASFLFGNSGVAGSNYVTVSPPTATSNYNLVWPQIPAQTNVVSLDTSGNFSSVTWDFIGQSMTSVGANAITASSQNGHFGGVPTVGALSNSLLATRYTTTQSFVIRGFILSTGTISTGTGFTVARTGVGQYTITWSRAYTEIPAVVGTAANAAAVVRINASTLNCTVIVYDNIGGSPTTLDANFAFIAIGTST